MKKSNNTILLVWFIVSSQTATEITNLQTPDLDETSGLVFYNDKIITHNNSGNEGNLYEISGTTGTIIRTVTITNSTNVDWEDITQDASYTTKLNL
jgi:hypothetical protein